MNKRVGSDVIVVGAGPTGLLLGCELARHGVGFRLLERAQKPSKLSRALGLHSRTMELFEDLGILEEALRRGHQLSATNIYRDGKLLKRFSLLHQNSEAEPYSGVLILQQSVVEQLLEERLRQLGGEVERGVEMLEFSPSSARVRCLVRDSEGEAEIQARYLVGCDGPRSRVRQQLEVAFQGNTYPKAYLLVEAEVDWELPAELHRFSGEDDDIIAIPLGGNKFRFTAWDRLDPGEQTDDEDSVHALRAAPPTLEHLQQRLDKLAPVSSRLSHPTSLLRYRVGRRLAEAYKKGPVFLAGDAAHVHPPTGGQGMNTGLQDAYNLGWKLGLVLAGGADERLLDSYEPERRPVGQWVLSNTDQASSAPASRFDLGGHRFHGLGSRLLLARWSQLSVNYRESPIVAHYHTPLPARHTQAGDRAPDGRLFSKGAGVVRLFELIRGTSHHLLVFTVGDDKGLSKLAEAVERRFGNWIQVHRFADVANEPGSYADLDGLTAASYSVHEPTAFLVRPDGYIGVRADWRQAHWLFGYLKNSFLEVGQDPFPPNLNGRISVDAV